MLSRNTLIFGNITKKRCNIKEKGHKHAVILQRKSQLFGNITKKCSNICKYSQMLSRNTLTFGNIAKKDVILERKVTNMQ